MSSYQFVNSLVNCYQQNAAAAAVTRNENSPGLDGGAPSPNSADYYANYGNQCYSPSGATVGHQQYQYLQSPSNPAMMDYTQLHPSQQQRLGMQNQHHQHPNHIQHGQLSPTAASPNLINNNVNLNCKFENESPHRPNMPLGPNGLSSPQDLTTSSTTPTGRTSPIMIKTSASSRTTPTGTVPPGPVSQSSSSPASSECSGTSTPGPNSSNSGNGKGSGNPPHIYPWMKRVHIGTSKSSYD